MTCLALKAVTSAWCAASLFAMIITPLVSLSSLCTIPGLIMPPMPERFSQWWRSPWTRVFSRFPAPGCTTRPAGLFTTTTWRSSKRISRSMGIGATSRGVGSGTSTCTTSLPFNLCLGSRHGFPLTVTCPFCMSSLSLVLEMSGIFKERTLSNRIPWSWGSVFMVICLGNVGSFVK